MFFFVQQLTGPQVYSINSIDGQIYRYFEEGKKRKKNTPAKYWIVPEESVQKMQQTCFRVQNSWTFDRGFKKLLGIGTLRRHPWSKLLDIVETYTAQVNRRRRLIKQGFSARFLVFNYSLPLMMLKIKQTNCLFVNFEKRKKNLTELIFFLNNKNKSRYMHIYRQTDIFLLI